MFSCVWCLIYWYWWCASGASVGWLVPNGHHHWAGRPRPCARTYNLEKSLSLSKHKHYNSKNSGRWVKRCDALRLDKWFCHRTASESDEADQSDDQRNVVTLTKYAELVFPSRVPQLTCIWISRSKWVGEADKFSLANYARYAAEQDKKYITKIKISWILRIKHCHRKPPKNRGIDLSKKRMIICQNIYHALFRHERAKGSIQYSVQWERKCLCCQKCPLEKPFPDPEQLSNTFDEERAKQGVMRVSVFVNPIDFRLLWLLEHLRC